MTRLLTFVLILSALLVRPVAAADPVPLLAVLEFDAPDQSATIDELMLVTNEFRGAVIATVGTRYKVITRENMEVLLPADQLKAAQCAENKCVAEIGRMLQSSHVMSGSMRKLEGEWVLTLEAYETNGGAALGTEQLYAGKVRELLGIIKKDAPSLVRRWLRLDAARADPQGGRVGQEQGFDIGAAEEVVVSVNSTPPGAVVMVDGRLACRATPCTKALPVGAHDFALSLEQYVEASRSVRVSRSERAVAFTLAPNFATYALTTVPEGLPLSVDGKPAGRAPLSLRLAPGAHTVLVQDGCWQELGEQVVAVRGEQKSVTITAVPRWSGVKLTAVDLDGNDLEASATVDGEELGTTPLTAKLPLCARQVRASLRGVVATAELSLREREVVPVQLRLKMPRTKPAAPVAVVPTVTAEKTPEGAVQRPQFALRAGLGGAAGIAGVAVEWRPSWWGLVAGTGYMPLGLGLTFGAPDNSGGFYADAHLVLLGRSVVYDPPKRGAAIGVTAGWDWRLGDGWSIKTGAGLGATSVDLQNRGGLLFDLSAGRVF